ncbi:bifunctional proline dehydrogenase/L-glutamate gamma-semialdehyde dehydrogenase [Corynebacterium crudilactis]|uniref:L-glutamate gamma-semialdehyde dehydrogenase n=1 Tax=Corynebacterium crudilactis TaxID=1652495 RepID=A0A172QQA0_9CORY|nr:proline dehydrogenase family protein [Corynebacterium crudilactis]ANE02863.1 aldehyde dehydrogenase [Corynebacterium crudilactis]
MNLPVELATLSDQAVSKVRAWLEYSKKESVPNADAKRLAAVLQDPNGLDFTVGFVDRVVRTEDAEAAAHALHELGKIAPATMSFLDRAQIQAGSLVGRALPKVVVPAARARIRQMVGHMIVDARDKQFGKAVADIQSDGHRLNINLLGEAVLGRKEAAKHLEDTVRLLRRPDVEYVSIKVSSVSSQISMWGFEDTVEYVVEQLTPLYTEAAQAPKGTKFINLDMEEYRDLRLTMEVFKRLLSKPELADFEAGIVLQAYLPDALGAIQDLAEFGRKRTANGGAGIKVRLVKGANLPMEHVHAQITGWPVATEPSKQATDANYKRVLYWTMRKENMEGLRLGVAGHNLFDIAFAHLLSVERGVADRVEFEMLQGMASDQARAVSQDVGDLLLYVPAVSPQEFDVAISYLVRRLEENGASENFMSAIFDLDVDNPAFKREESRFRASINDLATLIDAPAPGPNHAQDRSTETLIDAPLVPFYNEPDTNPALIQNQQWATDALATAAEDGWLDKQTKPTVLDGGDVEKLIGDVRAAAQAWAARPAEERARILYKTAELLAVRRGHLVSVAAAEVGKSVEQTDPEISEAIDFARYYAQLALDLGDVDNAEFTPDRVVVVTPPWNFPIAIPAGSTFAALAAGAGVIHKPSKPSQQCSAAVVEALWDAGVPREVLHCVYPADRDAGRALISNEHVDRVILTGSSETAAMFSSWRPEVEINAETSGKNAIVITPSADRDLAVADLVKSAFGHAGQKCSAASLGILVGSVYDSERFRKQLLDAASSLIVDWPTNPSATVGPLTELPSDKLQHALTTLEEGESWLLKPRQLDDSGRLWSPGIKEGVKPGTFFHLTEVFGPVLGLMKAADLEEAIEFQNGNDFGLTGGLQSLDVDETRTWLDRVDVGNAYVNRGITGAIVQRQSFGGWKKSSVGLGSKAGGPNYVMLMGTWADAPSLHAPRKAHSLISSLDLPGEDLEWIEKANASDELAWSEEFGTPRDLSGLDVEANIFRYRPAHVVLRLDDAASARDVARVLLAARRAGSDLRVLQSPGISEQVREILVAAGVSAETVDESVFISNLLRGEYDDNASVRVRYLGKVSDTLRERLAVRPEVALLDDAVTSSGRVELRYWLKEQAISMTLHRFGNPVSAFHELAEELKR